MGSRGKDRKNGPMYVDRKLIRSRAFLELTGCAAQVYLLFRARAQVVKTKGGPAKRSPWRIVNNGEIIFTYAEAEEDFGIRAKRFTRAIDQLVARGFLDIAHRGGGLEGDASCYALSERWRMYGTVEFVPGERPKGRRWVSRQNKANGRKGTRWHGRKGTR